MDIEWYVIYFENSIFISYSYLIILLPQSM